MTPRIIVKAGTSTSDLKPVQVNRESTTISSPAFEGSVNVRFADYHSPSTDNAPSNPSTAFSAEGDTWSIQISGRFLDEVNADEVMFGNSWDKPIKAHLPYGTSAALKFMTTVVDPSLDHDLYADKPWAVSPLLATMQRVSTETYPADKPVPKLVPGPVDDDLSAITGEASLKGHADKRRTYLATPANRQKIKLSKDTLVTADFSNGFIDFDTLSLKLPIGFHMPLQKYWDGQPVTFVCRRRDGSKTYFIITFTLEGDAPAAPPPKKEEEKPAEEAAADVDQFDVD